MRRSASLIAFGVLFALTLAAPARAAAPSNDAFASAQQLSGTSATATGTTVEATLEPGEPPHYTSGNGSVWYAWTAPENLVVRLDTCAGPGSTKVQLYRGSSLGSLTEVVPRSDSPQCAGNGDLRRFNVMAGTSYWISVIEYNGFSGDTSFTLALSAAPTPSNDDFATPQELGQQLNVDVDGTTAGSTVQPGEGDYGGGTVWYRWTAPKRMRVWIDNCDAASDSQVTVFTGGELASLDRVPENFGQPEPPYCESVLGRRTEFKAIKGTTYMIRVHSDLYEAGTFHLRLREILFDGSISQSASAKSVKKGKKVTYTVEVANLGTVPIEPWIQMLTSQPNKIAKPVVGTKYTSIKATMGTCSRVTFFAEHPGAVCKPGEMAPGDSLRIIAKVRPSRSLSHFIFLDYAHGGDSPIYDDNRANDPPRDHTTTIVKRKPR